MAGLLSVNTAQALHEKFGHKNMQMLMDYMKTQNCEDQTVAVSSSTGEADIGASGTKTIIMNGQPIYMTASSDLDISSSTTETSITAWATDTGYTEGLIRENNEMRYRCLVAHTSRDASSGSEYKPVEPGNSDTWEKYWEQYPHSAVNASGATLEDDYDAWFLVTSTDGGVLNVWEAGGAQAVGTAECKVPQFDPKEYCAIAFMHIANTQTSTDFVLGTTNWSTSGVGQTFHAVTGPVFPHADYWDKN